MLCSCGGRCAKAPVIEIVGDLSVVVPASQWRRTKEPPRRQDAKSGIRTGKARTNDGSSVIGGALLVFTGSQRRTMTDSAIFRSPDLTFFPGQPSRAPLIEEPCDYRFS